MAQPVREPSRKRRIVICDDSPAFSLALKQFLERDPGLEVVATFSAAPALLAELDRLRADLVIMDLEMPQMSGEEAIEKIMGTRPLPILVLSAFAGNGSPRTATALAAGALEAMPKSDLRLADPNDLWAAATRSRVRRLASVQLRRAALDAPPDPPRKRRPATLRRPAQVVAIGASTGGPPALAKVLGELPADYPIPILVVQHLPTGFVAGMAAWLDRNIALPVRTAREGGRCEPGVWFAPDGAHLLLEPSMRFAIDGETVSGSHRPAVDVLFESVAGAAGEAAVGVVLTGMGRDGGRGTAAIKAAGGVVLAQDEESSAVYGMPRVARQAGADPVLPLEEIAVELAGLRPAVAAR